MFDRSYESAMLNLFKSVKSTCSSNEEVATVATTMTMRRLIPPLNTAYDCQLTGQLRLKTVAVSQSKTKMCLSSNGICSIFCGFVDYRFVDGLAVSCVLNLVLKLKKICTICIVCELKCQSVYIRASTHACIL